MTLPDTAEYWWDIKGYSYEQRPAKKHWHFDITDPSGQTILDQRKWKLVQILKNILGLNKSHFRHLHYTKIVELLECNGYKIHAEKK